MAEVERKVVLGVEVEVEVEVGEYNASSLAEANDHSVDMGYIVESSHYCNTEEAMVEDGNNSRCTGACTHCTEVPPVDMVELDDHKVSFFPGLVAYLALPADDDRSSCRLARVCSFQTYLVQDGLVWQELSREIDIGSSLDGGSSLEYVLQSASALTKREGISIFKTRAMAAASKINLHK